jgi:TPP-dependent pyruvate/acetoin dehydrogenase alpha subunit
MIENMPETLLSITMQLVCKIKSEIIIIIIITMPQSATTVKPMEIKKALLLYQMLLIRRFEEKWQSNIQNLKSEGFAFVYWRRSVVGVMQALTEEDNVLCTYREHGHALARGIDADVIMAEMYGKIEGCSLGRGGSMHLFDVSKTLWRQCYRQQSFTAGCRNGFSSQKKKKQYPAVF